MNSQELRNLQEAYLKVVENQQLDESSSEVRARTSHKRMQDFDDAQNREMGARDDGASAEEQSKRAAETSAAAARVTRNRRLSSAHARSRKRMRDAGQNVNDSYEYDTFDVILSHLLDEGYADTQQQAEVIMVNMSEGWREEIMEGVRPTPVDKPLDKADFKKRRRSLAGREASADAESRGHVGKEWYNSGRRYSPDEARRSRANLDDEERRTRHRSAVDPDNEDDNNFSADRTKNPKKLRKQAVMDKNG